jgi:diguanylate cyclase (GGDEF)-like protein
VPVAPPTDAAIHRMVGAEVALIEALDLGDTGDALLVLGPRMTQAAYDANDLALLRALVDSSAIALRNAALLDRLRDQATLDTLTGCRNRRGLDELLDKEIARANRHRRPLSLVLLDIDHFKTINDDLGHETGDEALKRIGELLRSAVRLSDAACRYGGEEFVLILPETQKDEAMRVAERLRAAVENMEPDLGLPRQVTASLGVAAVPEDATDAGDLFRAVDRALYLAKAGGRNLVRGA